MDSAEAAEYSFGRVFFWTIRNSIVLLRFSRVRRASFLRVGQTRRNEAGKCETVKLGLPDSEISESGSVFFVFGEH